MEKGGSERAAKSRRLVSGESSSRGRGVEWAGEMIQQVVGKGKGKRLYMESAKPGAAMLQILTADGSELALRPSDPGLLQRLVAGVEAAGLRAKNVNTAEQDKCYWPAWVRYCELYGTPPWRTDVMANKGLDTQGAAREAVLQAGFVMWYYQHWIKAGRGRVQPLPSSATAALCGVRRVHKDRGFVMAPAPAAAMVLKHFMKEYIRQHGKIHLLPKRKEPLTRRMIEAMLTVEHGKQIAPGFVVDRQSFKWATVAALVTLMSWTGQRKSEALLPDGEPWDMSRASKSQTSWKHDEGTVLVSPTEQQLRDMDDKWCMRWTPGCSKQDYSGTHWAPRPMVMRYHPTDVMNAPRKMVEMELRFLIQGTEREKTPLFLLTPSKKNPMEFKHVEKLLRPWLVAVGACTLEESEKYSWHSFRIFLACALKKAGVGDADIQLILRWKSEASLHAYARLEDEKQISYVEAGLQVAWEIDVQQATNLPELDDYGLAIALEDMTVATEAIKA